jgi:YegS/Rv2252/BmrU family lipid kinase
LIFSVLSRNQLAAFPHDGFQLPVQSSFFPSTSMKKVALLYNPLSGSRREQRLTDMQAAVAVLRDAGIEVTAAPTRAPSDASPQVNQAIAEGCDTVFACGGDGTVHDVLQGLVGTQVALSIIPLGTANALAHDLGLPLSAAGAARAALTAKSRRVAVGSTIYRDLSGNPASRYFVVALGAGVDAALFHQLDPLVKVRFGMLAYYAQATWLWLTHPMQNFAVEFREANGAMRQAEVSEVLAVRVRNFGGVLRELAPGASLDRDDVRLVLFQTRSRFTYLRYIVRGLVGARWSIGGVELVHSASVVCQPLPQSSPIYVEADGEVLGMLPAEISMVPDALTILVPQR